MSDHYEAIVVGAGPAGNAAALTLAQAGRCVLQLERAEYPGAKNPHGAILFAPAMEELVADFRSKAPLERHIVEHRIWTLDKDGHSAALARRVGDDYAAGAAGAAGRIDADRYTVLRSTFDAWFAGVIKEAGVRVLYGTSVADLVRETDGRAVGVRTEAGDEFFADVVVLGDGIEAMIARRSGLRESLEPSDVALTVKEKRSMPAEMLDERFGIGRNEGVVVEAAGWFSATISGSGFIYTNRDSLSVGVSCLVGEIVESDITPSELLAAFKQHPSIRSLLQGSEVVEFAAQLMPEGGYRVRPRLYGDGWLTCGDATQLSDASYRHGSSLALTSGRLAGETIAELTRHHRPMNARHLSLYRDKLERSPVLKELRRINSLGATHPGIADYVPADPHALAQAARSFGRSASADARDRQRETLRQFTHKSQLKLVRGTV
ncbi:MAG: FAD-dependent oxidoreductase [Rhodospirillales bacterium]|nr:FAD-dependent oxidoreductase [Rhodospirillales bacterium]